MKHTDDDLLALFIIASQDIPPIEPDELMIVGLIRNVIVKDQNRLSEESLATLTGIAGTMLRRHSEKEGMQ